MPWGCDKWHKIRALFSAFYLGSSMSFSSFWDVIDHILSFCNALGVCLVTQDLLTKTIIKQLWDSDQTVMTQWSNSDAFDLSNFMSYFILLQCLGGVISDTRPFDKNSDKTVMRQWRDSDVTVMEQWFLWFELFNIISKVLRWWRKRNSILKLPTKEWHDESGHSQRPPSRPPKRRGSGHWAEAGCTVWLPMSGQNPVGNKSPDICVGKRGVTGS
jgi:hypothetical protein